MRQDIKDHLLALYDESWRRYHNRNHIVIVAKCVYALEIIQSLPITFQWEMKMAVDLHDVIYRPGLPGSEEASAILAECAGCGAEVGRLIRLTEKHSPDPDDIPGVLICNADLLGLASDPLTYKSNTQNIKWEYESFPIVNGQGRIEDFESKWARGRTDWIQSFLDRDHIYTGPHMERYDELARTNLLNELKEYK
jgi:predicted metal-dependent HD superfamily phosphohydrolase